MSAPVQTQWQLFVIIWFTTSSKIYYLHQPGVKRVVNGHNWWCADSMKYSTQSYGIRQFSCWMVGSWMMLTPPPAPHPPPPPTSVHIWLTYQLQCKLHWRRHTRYHTVSDVPCTDPVSHTSWIDIIIIKRQSSLTPRMNTERSVVCVKERQ